MWTALTYLKSLKAASEGFAVLNAFGFPYKSVFTNNVVNSLIGAKIQPPMSCYQVMTCLNLITETNEPHPIKPKPKQ